MTPNIEGALYADALLATVSISTTYRQKAAARGDAGRLGELLKAIRVVTLGDTVGTVGEPASVVGFDLVSSEGQQGEWYMGGSLGKNGESIPSSFGLALGRDCNDTGGECDEEDGKILHIDD